MINEANDPEAAKEPKKVCPNCDKKMNRKGKFCPHCGQKEFTGKISLADLIGRFVRNIVHLDSKFLRMVWYLFIPGKIATDYFQGKIKRYPNPVQFFFVIMFFFILCLNKSCVQNENTDGVSFSFKTDETDIDTIQKTGAGNLIDGIRRYATGQKILEHYRQLPDSLQSPQAQRAMDSVAQRISANLPEALYNIDSGGVKMILDSVPINMFAYSIRLSVNDIPDTPAEEIFRKYQITRWYDKVLIRQALKSLRDTKSLTRSYMSSLTWTILALTAFLAGVLFLMYSRRRQYYLEHFLFLLFYTSATLLLFTLILMIDLWVFNMPALIYGLAAIWSTVSMYLGLRRFYGGSAIGVIARMLVFGLAGIIGFAVFFTLGLLIVLMIF